MVQIIILGIVAFACAALLAYSLTPPVRVLAFKIGAVDVPLDERRVHKKPIPRIGGLAIYVSFLVSSALFCDITRQLVTIWIGGGVLVITGIIDDIFRIKAWIKLIIQIAAAAFAIWNGSVIEAIAMNPLGGFSIPITLLWIVGLTNAVNFIDGLDGLACGVSAISTCSLLLVFIMKEDYVSAIFCTILLGSCLGFLPFNFNPARIFMGDTGALFLGYAMAIISVQSVFKTHTLLSFIVPIVIFALPLFDALFSIVRRIIHKKSPFSADRGHIHHRLIDMGFTQKESVKILYAFCGIMGLVAVCFTDIISAETRIVKTISVVLIAFTVLIINYIIMKSSYGRQHSGLIKNDMTTDQYLSEIGEEKAKIVEKHNASENAEPEKEEKEN